MMCVGDIGIMFWSFLVGWRDWGTCIYNQREVMRLWKVGNNLRNNNNITKNLPNTPW